MPSPFPGMDPYLENPDWFPNLHDGLITFLVGSLMRRLPEAYYARSRQRIWLEHTHRRVEPDADVLRSARGPSQWERDNGGVAIAEEVELAEPVVVAFETVDHDPFEEPYIEIRRRHGSEDRLVASIEVVSPANKTPGNPGREKYLAKQQEILASQVHLIEIDLLRGGTHATAVPREIRAGKSRPVRLSRLRLPIRPARELFRVSDPVGAKTTGDYHSALAGRRRNSARTPERFRPGL